MSLNIRWDLIIGIVLASLILLVKYKRHSKLISPSNIGQLSFNSIALSVGGFLVIKGLTGIGPDYIDKGLGLAVGGSYCIYVSGIALIKVYKEK